MEGGCASREMEISSGVISSGLSGVHACTRMCAHTLERVRGGREREKRRKKEKKRDKRGNGRNVSVKLLMVIRRSTLRELVEYARVFQRVVQ